MIKVLLSKKCIAALSAVSLTVGLMPMGMTAMAAETAEIAFNANGDAQVSNVGAANGGYVTVDFSTDMDISTLNSENITITNGAGENIEYTADATARQYKIDKKYFSTIKDGGGVTTLDGGEFTINVSNVKTADSTVQADKSFTFTTGLVLPVSYKEGYVIENVALGKTVKELGTGHPGDDKLEYVNDGLRNQNGPVLRENVANKFDAAIMIDLGKQYDIAGVAIVGVNVNYYDRAQLVGGSNEDNKTLMNDVTTYIGIKYDQTDWNQARAKFYNFGETEPVRYIYAGSGTTCMGCRELYTWAYVQAENMVESTTPENGAIGITNIGTGNNNLVTIDFNTDMDTSTLSSANVVISNRAGEVIDYTPYSTDLRRISIDKKYFSKISKSGSSETLDGDTFTVTVAGAKSLDGRTQEKYSFSFTTGTILPVSYREGYIIENVALGKTVTEIGTGNNYNTSAACVTDGICNESSSFIKAVSGGKGGAACIVDLGRQYSIAGVAIAGAGSNNPEQWYNRVQLVGGSNESDKTVMADVTSFIAAQYNTISYKQLRTKFYDFGETEPVRYIYAGSATDTMGCSELYAWAYIQSENMIESTTPENGAKDITNVGDNATGEISIKFSKPIDVTTLTSNNIIIKNENGEIIAYSPKKVSETEYVIDTKALANIGGKKIPKKEAFTIAVGSGVASSDGVYQMPYEFTITTDYIVAPVSSVPGKKIVNVAKGKIPTGNCVNKYEHLGLTDGDPDNYDRYTYTARDNQTDDGYCFKIDLDGWYDIAGIVVQNPTDRANTWDNDHTRYLASADSLDTMAGAEEFASINVGIMNGQTVGRFYEYDEAPRYRYVYGGPAAGYKAERTLLMGEVYAFAYVDSDEDSNTIRLREYDINEFDIKTSGNSFSAVCKADREMNGTEKLVAALYKDGTLVDTAIAQNVNGTFETSFVAIPSDWATFPARDEHYTIKAFIWNGDNGMQPVLKNKTGIMPDISCWGDSFTYGYTAEGKAWTQILQEKLGNITKVNNFGLGGDTVADTAGRFGAAPFVLKNDVTISGEYVDIEIESSTGYSSQLLKKLTNKDEMFGSQETVNSGINPCYIGGVKGSIYYEDGEYIFIPEDKNQTAEVKAGTPIITNASLNNRDDIQIFMPGADEEFGSDGKAYALLERQMADYISSDVKKYIVVFGPYTLAASIGVRENLFGDNSLNLYGYFRNADALTADGVELTEQDKTDITEGNIPASLLSDADNKHLNLKGYTLLADKIYEKLNELGYISK